MLEEVVVSLSFLDYDKGYGPLESGVLHSASESIRRAVPGAEKKGILKFKL